MLIIIGVISGLITILDWIRRLINYALNPSADLAVTAKLYKRIYKAKVYKLVSNLFVGCTSNQSSPAGFPVALNRKEICDFMNSMLWLVVNKDINGIAKEVYNHITHNEWDLEYYTDHWHNPLLESFENDHNLIQIYTYSEVRSYKAPWIDSYLYRIYQWMRYQHSHTDYKYYIGMLIIVGTICLVII